MKVKKKSIFDKFPIHKDEYQELEKVFGQLCHYAAWQLLKRNVKNNHTDEFEDIDQDLKLALVQAGSYYKRQVYIEQCFTVAQNYAKDVFVKEVLKELSSLWKNRTRHGANKRKFGFHQEVLLDKIVKKLVPKAERPSRKTSLIIDDKFPTYCKQIIWNKQKTMGKRITREKSLRSGMTSLSEFDFLGSEI
jgi:uncharacterized phage-associated protein